MINLWIIPFLLVIILFLYNRTIFGYIAIGICILFLSPRINKINRENDYDSALDVLRNLIRLFLTVSGISLKLENKDLLNAEYDNNVFIMGNHTSNLDIMNIILNYDKKFFAVAKIEMKKAPIIWKLFDTLGILYLDRKDMRQSFKTIVEATKKFTKDNSFLIYPEGTRSDKLQELKAGSFMPISKNGGYVVVTKNLTLRECLETRKPFSLKRKGTTKVLSSFYVDKGTNTIDIAKKCQDILESI